MISRTIKNATFEVFDRLSGSEDHFEVAAVPAVPSGFSAHLTNQASRNDDSELRKKFAPWLFPYSIYVMLYPRALDVKHVPRVGRIGNRKYKPAVKS